MVEDIPEWAERLLRAQGELKEEIVALTTQVEETNGRVRFLEKWRADFQAEARAAKAYADGVATALVTKSSGKAIAALVTFVAAIAAGASALFDLLR